MSHLGAAGTPDAGISRKDLHDELERTTRVALEECAEFGAPNIVAMVGPRSDASMEECADNAVAFLNRVKGQAEELGVTICLENLNSKVDHKGYMFDRTPWGFEIVKRVDSPRVKVLFDVYHAQVQEGDVTRTHPRQHRLDRPHPLRGQPGSLPDRRGAGGQLSVHRAGTRAARLHRLRGPRVHADAGPRCHRVLEAGVRDRRRDELVIGTRGHGWSSGESGPMQCQTRSSSVSTSVLPA